MLMVTWANYTLTFLKELRVASRAAIYRLAFFRFLATTRITIGPILLFPQFVSRGGLVRKGRETGMMGNRRGRVTGGARNTEGGEQEGVGNKKEE